MSGAQALEAKVFSDAAFLINWDSENFDELTRGCAGSVGIDFRRELHWCNSIMPQAWCVSVSGLLGGHSGERIGDGRGNAIRILAQTLHVLKDAGVSCSLASITGGSARNAIAAEAKAVLVTQSRREEILHLISDMEQHVRTVLGNVDPGICIKLSEVEMPAQVMEDSDMEALTDALLLLHTGVFQMSSTMPGLVETSANLGLIRTEGSEVRFSYFARSSVDEKLGEIADTCGVLGMRLGLETSVATPSPGWRERPQSELSDIMATIFEEQNGRPMKVGVIHAGLECGWHIKKAPHLDMVSIGVTTHDIHSPKERLDLKTVVPQVRLVMETLHKIAQGK
jgi:dipeptidase D